jgi:hypothetical protein
MSVSRKLSAGSLAFVFLMGTAAAFAPAALSSWHLQRFCVDLPVGTTRASVESRAQAEGYELAVLAVLPGGAAGRARLHDAQRYVRRECEIQFDAKGVVSTKFGDFD